jgi:uncharacterized protein YndB with AHSA1/START domain
MSLGPPLDMQLKGCVSMTTNKIEKEVLLRAPVSRVWRSITDAQEFSRWFGFELHGQFAPGIAVLGTFRGTLDENAIIAHQQSLGVVPSKIRMPGPNTTFCTVEKMESERLFSFRWIPYGIDAEADIQSEPTTLVEFHLEAVAQGTRLRIIESGFDAIPAHRRQRAFRMNEGGWTAQLNNVKRHVEGA